MDIPATVDSATMTAWPLVGRDGELGSVVAALDAPGGAVIVGPAGVGKTRLAREAGIVAASRGDAVVTIVCSESGAMMPLGAFSSLLTGSGGGAALLAQARAALERQAGGRRIVLIVDDAHLLDRASAVLVHQLAAGGRATVVATIRSGCPSPDAVVALWKDELCRRLDLGPLTEQATGTLLTAVLGDVVDGRARRALWLATEGNVLFLREVVRSASAEGRLVRQEGIWTLRGALVAPPTVRELLAAKLVGLSVRARIALDAVTLGEPLDTDVVRAVAGVRVLDRIVDLGLAVEEPSRSGTQVRLAHPLLGDVVRDAMSTPHRRRLLGRLAAELARSPAARTDAMRIVVWRIEAGEAVAVESLVSAAKQCVLLDNGLAERLARLACAGGGSVQGALVLAELLMFTGRGEEATVLLQDASSATGLAVADARELTVKLANVLTFGLGRPLDGLTRLAIAEHEAEQDPAGRCFVRGHMAAIALFGGRMEETIALADAVLADGDASPSDRARVLLAKIPALAAAGAPASAASLAEAAFPVVRAVVADLPYGLGQLGSGLTVAHQWAGSLATADAIAGIGYREGLERDIPLMRAVSALRLGQQALWRGRALTAATYLREAVIVFSDVDAGFAPATFDHLGVACALVGERAGADDARRRANDSHRQPMYAAEHVRCSANVHALLGEQRAGRLLAMEAAEIALSLGQRTYAALCAYDAARFGDAAGGAALLETLASTVDGALVPMMASGAQALRDDDGGALAKAADELCRLEFVLFAAELYRAAAQCFDGAGLVVRASRASELAAACERDCEGAVTPLTQRRPASAPLTSREREVAGLAAQGRSDAAIAEVLGVSRRTVQTHLARVYAKLGVAGRRDLAGAFGGAPGDRSPHRRP